MMRAPSNEACGLTCDCTADCERMHLAPDATELRERLGWPRGSFSVFDPDPSDDHGPIYLVCPTSGLMVDFSSDPEPGRDAARLQWIAATLNAALRATTPAEASPVGMEAEGRNEPEATPKEPEQRPQAQGGE